MINLVLVLVSENLTLIFIGIDQIGRGLGVCLRTLS